MMKIAKLILTLVIALVSIQAYSQSSNEIQIHYGIYEAALLRNVNLDGGGSYKIENFNEFGLNYSRHISSHFHIETGIIFFNSNVEITPDFTGEPVESRKEKLELISIPFYANYTFWNYIFVNGGPMLDFQITDNSSDSQSGIGYSIGIGGKYYFDNLLIFVNPVFKRHSVIPFEKENYHQKLTELGIQFGIGIGF